MVVSVIRHDFVVVTIGRLCAWPTVFDKLVHSVPTRWPSDRSAHHSRFRSPPWSVVSPSIRWTIILAPHVSREHSDSQQHTHTHIHPDSVIIMIEMRWLGDWLIDWLSEWVIGLVGELVSVLVSVWVSECVSEWVSECIYEWPIVWLSRWVCVIVFRLLCGIGVDSLTVVVGEFGLVGLVV